MFFSNIQTPQKCPISKSRVAKSVPEHVRHKARVQKKCRIYVSKWRGRFGLKNGVVVQAYLVEHDARRHVGPAVDDIIQRRVRLQLRLDFSIRIGSINLLCILDVHILISN